MLHQRVDVLLAGITSKRRPSSCTSSRKCYPHPVIRPPGDATHINVSFAVHDQVEYIGDISIGYFNACTTNRQVADRALDDVPPIEQDPRWNGCRNPNVASALNHAMHFYWSMYSGDSLSYVAFQNGYADQA